MHVRHLGGIPPSGTYRQMAGGDITVLSLPHRVVTTTI